MRHIANQNQGLGAYSAVRNHPPQINRAREIRAQFIKNQLHDHKEGKKIADIHADGVVGAVGLITPKDEAKK